MTRQIFDKFVASVRHDIVTHSDPNCVIVCIDLGSCPERFGGSFIYFFISGRWPNFESRIESRIVVGCAQSDADV